MGARTLHLVAADRLGKVLFVLRWGDKGKAPRRAKTRTALDLLTPETREALEKRLGKAKAWALCENERRAALATAKAMKASAGGDVLREVFGMARPPLKLNRPRKRGRKG